MNTRLELSIMIALAAILGFLTYLIFKPFLSVLAISGALTIVVYPIFQKLNERLKGRRVIAASLTVALAVLVLVIPLSLISFQVFEEASSTYLNISNVSAATHSSILELAQMKLQAFFPSLNIDLQTYFAEATRWLLSNIGTFFSGTIDFGFKLFLSLVALFYLLKDGEKFMLFVQQVTPLRLEYKQHIIENLVRATRSIMRGSIVVAIVQGLVSGIGFTIAGVPNPALWGTAAGIASFIPGLGTALVIIPVLIYLIVIGSFGWFVFMLIWGGVAVGLVDNFLSPKLIEKGVNVHPLIILFSIIGGISFFGPEGFILGPLCISVLFSLFSLFQKMFSDELVQEQAGNLEIQP